MSHEGHRQRMRERYREQGGFKGFAPHEVLELWLYYAIPQKNVNTLAHELICHFGSLSAVLRATPEQLMRVKGVGEYSAVFLSLFSQLTQYCELEQKGKRVKLATRKEAEDYCVHLLSGERNEVFYAVCLNGKMEVIYNAMIARGTLSEVPFYPRVVAEEVLMRNAQSVLFCHNHPGGSLVPSSRDMEITGKLASLLQSLEITMIDHIIVSESQALSILSDRAMR